MLRISKLTDYGTLLMAFLAANSLTTHTAKDIAHHTHLALPTVSKLLKLLAKGGLLQAHRGVKGGYGLARPAAEITLAEIIAVLEGNIVGLTECSQHSSTCNMQTHCAVRGNWRTISDVIRDALNGISLAEMAKPLSGDKLQADIKTVVVPVKITRAFKTT